MPSLASFQFLNVVELNPVPQSIFRLQTTANETAVYRTRLHLQNGESAVGFWIGLKLEIITQWKD